MKIKRIFAFRVIVLLMLTALVMIPMIPASADPGPWDWFPYTKHYTCKGASGRYLSICTWPTDAEILNKTVYYANEQYYDMEFSSKDGSGLVNITVPKESYHSDAFYLKPLGPFYIWMQVYLDTEDGNGTLDTVGATLDVSPITINVTGDGAGNFTTAMTVGDGVPDGAGSAMITMPLKNDVWLGASETDPTVVQFLFTMDFPMITTTGFIEARIDDTAGPYPVGSVSMDGSYMNLTGVPFDPYGNTVTLAGAGAGLDIPAYVVGIGDIYTDYVFVDDEVLGFLVGGTWIPVDKLALLAPYIALVSTIVLAVAATAIFKYRKKQ